MLVTNLRLLLVRLTKAAVFGAVLCSGAVYAEVVITQESLAELQVYRDQMNEFQKQISQNSIAITKKQLAISNSKSVLRGYEAEYENAVNRLQRLEKDDRENPDYGLGPKVQEQRAKKDQVFARQEEEKEKLSKLDSELNGMNSDAILRQREFDNIKEQFDSRLDAIVDMVLAERVRDLQAPTRVEGLATVSCNNESIVECQDRAKRQAEQNASEKGSIVAVNSVTEIRNFKLSKEEVRSEVRANLSNIEIVEKGWAPGSDTSYRVKLTALVSPVIAPALRQEMRDATRFEIIGRMGGNAVVTNGSKSRNTDESEDRRKQEAAQQEREARRKREAEEQQRAREEEQARVREEQMARQRAEDARRKKQAEEEQRKKQAEEAQKKHQGVAVF